MEKMTISRFREIKEKFVEVYKYENDELELTEEQGDELLIEVDKLLEELHNSDLSEIPIEEYEGFYDLGVNFEGTGATLDFSIINEELRYSNDVIRAKGCNVINFDFENIPYDEESFDEEFVEREGVHFWGVNENYPKELRDRYYSRSLTMQDLITYSLSFEDLKDRVNWNDRYLLTRYPLQVISQIDLALYRRYEYQIDSKLGKNNEEITIELFENAIKEVIRERFEDRSFSIYEYEELLKFEKIKEYAGEYWIDFSDDDVLKQKFFSNSLYLEDIKNNLELFRNKDFCNRMRINEWTRNQTQNLTSEKIIYMFDNYPEFCDDIILLPEQFYLIANELDTNLSKEENQKKIEDAVRDIISNDSNNKNVIRALSRFYTFSNMIQNISEENDRYGFENIIMKYTTEEKIREYNIPMDILNNSNVIWLFKIFGLETVMDFDAKNGHIFTKNDYDLLKKIYPVYVHYDQNDHDYNTKICHKKYVDIDFHTPYTPEEFEESVRRMIVSGRDKAIIDYRDFSESFKQKNPTMFLSEDAPEELKDKFYSKTLIVDDLRNNEGWTNYLEGKDYFLGMTKIPLYIILKNHRYVDIIRYLNENVSANDALNFLVDNSEILKYLIKNKNISTLNEYFPLDEYFSLDKLMDLASIDDEAVPLYGADEQKIEKFKNALELYPDKLAMEELAAKYKQSAEEIRQKLLHGDDVVKSDYDNIKRKYYEDIVKSPGLLLHSNENLTRKTIKEYRNLSINNNLKDLPSYRRDIYEQILVHMYEFLGFDEAKRLVNVPKIDTETLDEIYATDGRIKELYEKKFEIKGNIKILSSLFKGMTTIMPEPEKITSKNTLKLYKTINAKINNGYIGNIEELLKACLSENEFPQNDEGVYQLVKDIVLIHTEEKLDYLREYNSNKIELNIHETPKTKKAIKEIYRSALKYSLIENEKIDIDTVRSVLESKFSKTNSDGTPFYSTHITSHLEDLIKFTEELMQDEERISIVNKTIVNLLEDESKKVGKRWITKIADVSKYPDKMTYEEITQLENNIYGEESEFEFETADVVELKKLDEKEKKELFELLNKSDYSKLFTFGKAEIMFSAFVGPYSDEFKNFFLKYKEEFLEKSELYTALIKMHNKFDEIISEPDIRTRYDEGLYKPNDLLDEINQIVYPNVQEGEFDLAYKARRAQLSDAQFAIAQRLMKEMQKREVSTVPPEQASNKRFRGRIVRIDDPIHFTIGETTNCCQTIGYGQPGESSMIHSATEANGSLFVVEELDELGNPTRIVAQSWTWRNGNRVCYDNVEIPQDIKKEFKKIGGFDEIISVYEETAKKMIETDKKFLLKLLEEGKISKEQYESSVIKDIAMGIGCDDLIGNLSSKKRAEYPGAIAVMPLEDGKKYTGSSTRGLYNDSRAGTILIAHNEDFSSNDHTHISSEVKDIGVRYTKIRDTYRRTGKDINPDMIEKIVNLVRTERNGENELFTEDVKFISQVNERLRPYSAYENSIDYDRYRTSMSENGDWFILSEKIDNGIIVIHDSLVVGEKENETSKQAIDRKMALSEYQKEIYLIMEKASNEGMVVSLDMSREGKNLDLDSLVNEGIIKVDNGVVSVIDPGRLHTIIEELDKGYEENRRDRILIYDDER